MNLNLNNFQEVLASEKLHIPLEANFFVIIPGLPALLNKLDEVASEISPNNGQLQVESNNSIWNLETDKFNNFYFATSISLPGESVGTGRVGFSSEGGAGVYGGLLSGPVLRGRKDNTNLEIGIIETNVSFIDLVIRPWIVAVSQYGLFARNTNSKQNFKTTVGVTFLDKTNGSSRKLIQFNNAAPVEVAGYEAGYGSGRGVELRVAKTVWTYSTYSISSNPLNFTSPSFNNSRGRERTPIGA